MLRLQSNHQSMRHGALIDDYFAGAAWGNTYREALLLIDDVVNDQFEVCEQFYTADK